MAGTIFRTSPSFVGQFNANSCWAAALEMWFTAELGYQYWTQRQLLNSAGDFTIGPGGINLSGLEQVISDSTSVGTIQMYTKEVQSAGDVPAIADILNQVGYVYVAFTVPSGSGGHVNILTGYDGGSSYAATDPDPSIRQTNRSHSFYFSSFPGLVGWRLTPAMPGIGYTGRAPWDY